jgi:hypothetical protein
VNGVMPGMTNKEKEMKKLIVMLVLGAMATASAATWDGGGTNASWQVKENWTTDALPGWGNTLDIYFNTIGAGQLSTVLGGQVPPRFAL